jgi:hypothetical protein
MNDLACKPYITSVITTNTPRQSNGPTAIARTESSLLPIQLLQARSLRPVDYFNAAHGSALLSADGSLTAGVKRLSPCIDWRQASPALIFPRTSPRKFPSPSAVPRGSAAPRHSRRGAAAIPPVRLRSSPGCAPCADAASVRDHARWWHRK